MQKITTFLWFDHQAEEAAKFYISLFPNSHITHTDPMMVTFTLDGQDFMALNGGPMYKFTEAISLFVTCANQAEVDSYWAKFLESGGQESMCGWLKDKYGLSWQIIPKQLGQLLADPNPAKAKATMDAMLKMHKIIVADLQSAAEQA